MPSAFEVIKTVQDIDIFMDDHHYTELIQVKPNVSLHLQ